MARSVPDEAHGFYDNAPSDSGDDSGEDGMENLAVRKGRNLAAAFGKIMEKSRTGRDGKVPILVGQKHSAEQDLAEEEEMQAKVQKKMRQEMRKRGHVKVPKRGQDPEQDTREKALQKLATKGVVRLFNAVSQSQQQQREKEVLSKHRVQQSKTDFFQELRGTTSSGMNDQVGQLMAKASGGSEAPGWSVLRDDFALQGGTKMKDWDKDQDEEAGMPDEALDVSDGDSDSGDGGSVDDSDSQSKEEEEEEEEEEESEEEYE